MSVSRMPRYLVKNSVLLSQAGIGDVCVCVCVGKRSIRLISRKVLIALINKARKCIM